jgi:hypothetical protein
MTGRIVIVSARQARIEPYSVMDARAARTVRDFLDFRSLAYHDPPLFLFFIFG